MYRHKEECKKRNPEFQFQKRIAQQAKVFARSYETATLSDTFKTEVFPRMEHDDIYDFVMSDELILSLGQYVFDTPDVHEGNDRAGYVSQKMRKIGRFLKQMRIDSLRY